jgi:hypothetical protein
MQITTLREIRTARHKFAMATLPQYVRHWREIRENRFRRLRVAVREILASYDLQIPKPELGLIVNPTDREQ